MLEMMKGMMDKKPGDKKGDKPGDQPGEGGEGTTDKTSSKIDGSANNTKEERRVPKNPSAASRTLPREEQRAIDAYNKQKKATKK